MTWKRRLRLVALVAAALPLLPLPRLAPAQEVMDSRWLPWLGCWQAGEEGEVGHPVVCVRPALVGSGVEVATVAAGEIVSTRTLVADGAPHELQAEGCSGWQSAIFSADGRRTYLRSDVNCPNGVKRSASAIMAIASGSEWLDAQSLGMDGRRMPRLLRYRPLPGSAWPAGFGLTPEQAAAVADARLLARDQASLADVEEAASRVDQEALVAFLIERDQPFELTAARIAALDDAGVADAVIDALVAVSYPTKFVIDRESMGLALRPTEQGERQGYASPDPFGWGWWGTGACYGGLGYWSPYCGQYYYGALGFGLGWYWYSPYSYGYWGRPIIVVRNPNQPVEPHGRVVNGRGYSRGGLPEGSTGGRYAKPRGAPGQDRSGHSPSVTSSPPRTQGGVSSGGYSRSGGSPSSASSSGTAKPRCCS